jgi:proteasome activator subunit 4
MFANTILAIKSDRPSVQELIRKLFFEYYYNFRGLLLSFSFSDNIKKHIGYDTLHKDAVEKNQNNLLKEFAKGRQVYETAISDLLNFVKTATHWRSQTMATNAIDLFLSYDEDFPIPVISYFLDLCTHDHPTLRRLGIMNIKNIMYQQKILIRRKTGVAHSVLTEPLSRQPFVENQNPVFNGAYYHDTSYEGWYSYSKAIKVYERNRKASIEELLPEQYQAISDVVTNQQFWEKFITFQSMEQTQDSFDGSTSQLYFSFFRVFKLKFIELIKPFVEGFIQEQADERLKDPEPEAEPEKDETVSTKPGDKSKIRACCEIISGLIRAFKHWSTDETSKAWEWVESVLVKAFEVITPETLLLWESFLKATLKNRDPERNRGLLKLIMDTEMTTQTNSFFNETRKMSFLRIALHEISWKYPKSEQMFKTLISFSESPYKQVRQQIGLCMHNLNCSIWSPKKDSLWFLEAVKKWAKDLDSNKSSVEKKRLATEVQVVNLTNSAIPNVKGSFPSVEESSEIISSPVVSPEASYINQSKTILYWMHEGFMRSRSYALFNPFDAMFTLLFEMLDSEDKDLNIMIKRVLHLIPQNRFSDWKIQGLMTSLLAFQSESWHVKLMALHYFQVLYFRHMFNIDQNESLKVVKWIFGYLVDVQIEVRELASVTLSGRYKMNTLF